MLGRPDLAVCALNPALARALIVEYLPWVLSAITIYMNLLAGSRHRHTWAIGLAGQVLWLVWIFADHAWGLLPLNVALWIVYARNHLKWKREL